MNPFQGFLSMYDLLDQTPRDAWYPIFEGQRAVVVRRLRDRIWYLLPSQPSMTTEVDERFHFPRKGNGPSDYFARQMLQPFKGRAFVLYHPKQTAELNQDFKLLVDQANQHLTLRFRPCISHDFDIRGCLFFQSSDQTEWKWIPFRFRLEAPPSQTRALSPEPMLKRLMMLPFVEQFTRYGQPPTFPPAFYLAYSKLRGRIFDALFRTIEEQSDPRITRMGHSLFSQWKSHRERMHQEVLSDVPGHLNCHTQLWELELPFMQCRQLSLGDRVSVRCRENELYLYVGFVRHIDRRAYRVGVSFQLPKSIGTDYVFPILRFHLNATPYYYMALALCRSSVIKDALLETRFELIQGPPGSGKSTTLVRETISLLQDRDPRILLLCSSEETGDRLAQQLIAGLRAFTLSRPLKEIVFRLHEWDRDFHEIPKDLLEISAYDKDGLFSMPTKFPFRVWILTVQVARVLDRMTGVRPFTHVFVDDASRISECELLVPLTTESACQASRILLTGDLQQPTPRTAPLRYALPSMFERLWTHPTVPRKQFDTNYRSIPSCVQWMSESVYHRNLVSLCKTYDDLNLYAKHPGPISVYGVHTPKEELALLRELLARFVQVSTYVACSLAVQAVLYPETKHPVGDALSAYNYDVDVLIVSLLDLELWNVPSVFNTLVSRPRSLLIVLGVPVIMQADALWNRVFVHAVRESTFFEEQHEYDRTCEHFLPEFLLE